MDENKAVSNSPLEPPRSSDSNDEDEEIDESFLCCVCLDLLHKPIVLACGHISCFWCVHRTMSGIGESHCPICRCPYSHFPSVCQLLHLLLLKMYPVASKRRGKQVLEEEESSDIFSPQLVDNLSSSNSYKDSLSTSTTKEQQKSDLSICETKSENSGESRVSIDDLLCAACKQLLFQPSVLNCGHVYCQSCIASMINEALRCQVCQSLHPKGSPKICLELDHLLEERFPTEYTLRRKSAKLQTPYDIEGKHGSPHKQSSSTLSGDQSINVHVGIGCDYCGVYPILGERYKCMDCVEIIGFDLCGECYNTHSKLPGRFNQNHKPEHKFERINSNPHFMLMLAEQTIANFAVLVASDDDFEDIPPFQVVSDAADEDEDDEDDDHTATL